MTATSPAKVALKAQGKGKQKADSSLNPDKRLSDAESSDSETDSASDDSSDSDSDQITLEYLNGLLAKAKANMARDISEVGLSGAAEELQADEIRLDGNTDDKEAEYVRQRYFWLHRCLTFPLSSGNYLNWIQAMSRGHILLLGNLVVMFPPWYGMLTSKMRKRRLHLSPYLHHHFLYLGSLTTANC